MKKVSWKTRFWEKSTKNKKQRKEIKRKRKRKNRAKHAAYMKRRVGKQRATPEYRKKKYARIILPKRFDLLNNYDKTAQCFELIRNASLNQKRDVRLVLKNLEFIQPAAMLVLGAEIYRCSKIHAGKLGIGGDYPDDQNVEIILQIFGFFDLIKVQNRLEISEPSDPIKVIKFLTDNWVNGRLVKNLEENLFGGKEKTDKGASGKLFSGITEAMANVSNHAYVDSIKSKIPGLRNQWWMTGAIDKKNQLFNAIFFDQGVGIPATVPNNYPSDQLKEISRRYRTKNADGDLIHAAMALGRTRTGEKHRGKGLTDIRELIDSVGQESVLKIISGKGQYIYDSKGIEHAEFKTNKTSLGGTMIEWQIPLGAILPKR